MFPFNSPAVANWLIDNAAVPATFPKELTTVGSGPFEEFEFDDVLRGLGVTPQCIGASTRVLVTGREGWDPTTIAKLLDDRAGQELRLYTQEMLVAFWLTGADPLTDRNVATGFGAGHPAVAFIASLWVEWPSCQVRPSPGSGHPIGIEDAPQLGVLRHLGYRTGINGLDVDLRRRILRRVFAQPLPFVNSREYMAEWGKPGSARRLQKLAKSLAAFHNVNALRGNKLAARHYLDDLAWLKQQLYTGRFQFHWPSTVVG